MSNPFTTWQAVSPVQTEKTPILRYEKESMPNFIGTFSKVITIEYQNEKFDRIIFENVHNADTGTFAAEQMSVKPYAQLIWKLKGKEGKEVGVSYLGLEKHPKNPAKTLQTFAVYLRPQDETDNLPF